MAAGFCTGGGRSDGTQAVGGQAVAISVPKRVSPGNPNTRISEVCNYPDPVPAEEPGSRAAHPERCSCVSNSPLLALSS